jgi:hypothetical protein
MGLPSGCRLKHELSVFALKHGTDRLKRECDLKDSGETQAKTGRLSQDRSQPCLETSLSAFYSPGGVAAPAAGIPSPCLPPPHLSLLTK